MAHGYIGDGYGIDGGPDRDRDEDREGGWRGRDDERREGDWDRDRGMMFRDRDRDRSNEDSWNRGRYGRERSFSAHPDDHYLSWRDRHMSELDRDYADYCREREERFHRDFDAWLTERHGNPGPLRTGMAQTGFSHEPEGELELTDPAKTGQAEEDPIDTATLGTTSGGGKRR
jgi:hypothetical protein